MDKGIEVLIADMKETALKATPGEWYSDHIDTDGTYGNGDDCREGWRAAGVYSENGDLLLDSSNSDAATICEEYDEDGFIAFDETGFKNAEFVVACRPENVLKLIAALEQAHRIIELDVSWIKCSERIPEEKNLSYQVLALSTKIHGPGNYEGEQTKTIVQDWVVRRSPDNFTHWMPIPALPKVGE